MGGGGDRYGKSISFKSSSSSSKSSSTKPPSSYAPPPQKAPQPLEPAPDKEAVLSSFHHTADKTGIDVAFSFDTTASMYPCLQEVRDKLQEITARLLKDIPNIRIAFIAHGDFCEGLKKESYVIKAQDFSQNQTELIDFVKNVGKTYGDDLPEAYELALRDSLTLSWDPNHSKALIVIGDEIPHPASYTDQDIFWRDQVAKLAQAGVVVYGIQALDNDYATPFYSEISTSTGGFHLRLKDFSLITEMFVAVCFRASSQEKFEAYQAQMETAGGMTSQVKDMLSDMAKPTEKKTFNLREPWWDRQFDTLKPKYKYDAAKKQWVPA